MYNLEDTPLVTLMQHFLFLCHFLLFTVGLFAAWLASCSSRSCTNLYKMMSKKCSNTRRYHTPLSFKCTRLLQDKEGHQQSVTTDSTSTIKWNYQHHRKQLVILTTQAKKPAEKWWNFLPSSCITRGLKFSVKINHMQWWTCKKYKNKAVMKTQDTTLLQKVVEKKDRKTTSVDDNDMRQK